MKCPPRLSVWLLAAATVVFGIASAADWPAFRGADGLGVAPGETIRTAWSESEGIAWRADLPGRSVASPIVVGDLVVTTASSGPRQDRLHVVAYDRETGRPRWQRRFTATGRTLTHPTSAVASCTPASDAARIVALFSSCDLFALDLDGRLVWQRNLAVEHPRAGNDVGMGSSPRIIQTPAGGVVVVQIDCQGDAFAAGIDLADGEDRWLVERRKIASWATPLELACPGGPGVLLQNPEGLELREAATGKLAWSWEGDCSGIPMTTASGELVCIPSDGLTAVVPGGPGRPAWRQPKLSCGIASPLAFGGSLATINRGGVLVLADAASGKVRKQLRLAGSFWASPILVGELLVAVNKEGTAFLVRVGEEPVIVAQNTLPGSFTATPAVADGSLFLQSESTLWKTLPPPQKNGDGSE